MEQTSVYRHIICFGIPRRQRSRGKVSGTALFVFDPALLGIRGSGSCRSSWLRDSSSRLGDVSGEIRNGAADRLTGFDSGYPVVMLRAGPRMRQHADLAQGLISCLLTISISNSSLYAISHFIPIKMHLHPSSLRHGALHSILGTVDAGNAGYGNGAPDFASTTCLACNCRTITTARHVRRVIAHSSGLEALLPSGCAVVV